MGKVLDFDGGYNELVLTGGEPLMFPEFIAGFIGLFKNYRNNLVYLETNGTLPEALEKVIDHVDIVAMDFKLPSSTGGAEDVWNLHERFAAALGKKELIIKAVITGSTLFDDIKRMASVIKGLQRPTLDIVLQPVTPENDLVAAADREMLYYFKKYLEKETKRDILVFGQIHKCLGIR